MQANTGPGSNNQPQKSSLSWSQPAVPPVTPVTKSAPVTTPARTPVVVNNTSYTGTYVGIFVAGLIIGALTGWAISSSRNNGTLSPTASSTPTTTGTSTSTANGGTPATISGSNSSNAFTVASPQTAGFAVMVSNVQVTQPTWVVVYEDRSGVSGNALGAALFLPQSGNSMQNGTVQLLRATLPGQNYLAGEALDNGNKTFSLQNDKPIRDAQGNPVLVQFTAQ